MVGGDASRSGAGSEPDRGGPSPARGLPGRHLARPRLTDALSASPVGLVEAGGGFGKSVLAAEARAGWQGPVVEVVAEARHADAEVFAAALLGQARAAGLPVGEPAGEPGEVADAVVAALAEAASPVLVVLDEVHLLGSEAAALVMRVAEQLPAGCRLLVLGRRVPAGARRLRERAGVAALAGPDLALTSDEVAALAEQFGLSLTADQVVALRAATGGWAAAMVLAAGRVVRATDPEGEIERIALQPAVLSYLVDESLAPLSQEDRDALVQLAHLARVSAEVAREIGDPGLLDRLTDAGVPLTSARDGWFELPGPVVEYLAAFAPLRAEVARAAAAVYHRRGETLAALDVLLAVGEQDEAAALLAGLSSRALAGLEAADLAGVVDRLSNGAVSRHPRVLLHLARASEAPAQFHRRSAALARAEALLAAGGDQAVVHEVQAEIARDEARDGRLAEAGERASRVVAEAGTNEARARARALDTLGQLAAWRQDDESLGEAARYFEESAELARRVGEPVWEAQVLVALGYMVHFTAGRHRDALACLDRALELVAGRSRWRVVYLTFRGEVLAAHGDLDAAEVTAGEVIDIATRLRDQRALAYGWWERARIAALRGDVAGTRDALRAVEEQRGDWFTINQTGVYFLADAAEFCDLVGDHAAAAQYLERACERRGEAPGNVALAEAAILARSGDPEEADVALDAALATADRPGGLEVRERWRHTMLRAYAALRRGDSSAAALAARAFDEAAAIGLADLPLRRERRVAEALAGLAAGAGSEAAAALLHADLPVFVATLGRCEVRVGGRPIEVPAGKPSLLLRFLAARGGRAHAEEVIEVLWPEIDPDRGRAQLRTVLARLRRGTDDDAEDLVRREEETLTFDSRVRVDAVLFDEQARRALRAGAGDLLGGPALARVALAWYRGDLLPDDRYEDWAAGPRERLRRLRLDLLDLLAADAERRGDGEGALASLELAIESEPDDESRYVRAARLLLGEGRSDRALALLARAETALVDLGLEPSAEARRLAAEARHRGPA